MKTDLDFLWSGEDFKIRDHFNPEDPHLIRLTYGEAKLLNKYCKKAKKGILEIGRFFGGSTYLIVVSSPKNIPVLSVDLKNYIKIYEDEKEVPHKIKELKKAYTSDEYKKVVNYLNEAKLPVKPYRKQDKKLTLLHMDSKKLELKEDYDVAFIDGDHSYGGVKNDLEKSMIPSMKYILLHDYYEKIDKPLEVSKEQWFHWCKRYGGIKEYIDDLVSKNICKRLEKTDTMIALEYKGGLYNG